VLGKDPTDAQHTPGSCRAGFEVLGSCWVVIQHLDVTEVFDFMALMALTEDLLGVGYRMRPSTR
jgi:hypothetical protein